MLHVSEQPKSHKALRTSHNTMDVTHPKQPIPHQTRHKPTQTETESGHHRSLFVAGRLWRHGAGSVSQTAENTAEPIRIWLTGTMCCSRKRPAFSPSVPDQHRLSQTRQGRAETVADHSLSHTCIVAVIIILKSNALHEPLNVSRVDASREGTEHICRSC